MVAIERIAPDAWRAAPWGAGQGTTHEIARWPADAARYAARLSVAEITAPGPFTPLPGYARWLAVLDDGGGLTLTIGGRAWRGRRGATVRFDGADAVTAAIASPARVCNLIVQDGVAWSAAWLAASIVRAMPPGVTVIHAVADGDVAIDGVPHALAAGSTLVATTDEPIAIAVDAPAVLAHLGIPAPRAVVAVDGAAMTTPAAMHAELARAFGFPAWYGHNLDALLDCLSSLDEPGMSTLALAPGGVVTIAIADASAMPEALYHALLDTIAAANQRAGATGSRVAVAAAR